MPLAFDANAVGPSLEAAGQNRAQACQDVNLNPGTGSHGRDGILISAWQDVDVRDPQDWYNFCVPYLIEDDLVVGGPEEPSLWIRPGVEMRLARDKRLFAGKDAENQGRIEISGDSNALVTIRGMEDGPGSWGGLHFTEFDGLLGGDSSIFDADIRDGGSGAEAMVMISSTVYTRNAGFAGASNYPVAILPDLVGEFVEGLASGGGRFENNGVERILVRSDLEEADVRRSSNWLDPGVPLEIAGDLLVAGEAGDAALKFGPGLKLRFAAGTEMVLGHPELGTARWEVAGERGKSVSIAGLEATPGYWQGIRMNDETFEVEIEELDLAHGGAGGRPMLDWADVDGVMRASRLHHAAGDPLRLIETAIPILCSEEQSERESQNLFEDNGRDMIAVQPEGVYQIRDTYWYDPGVPLVFEATIQIGGVGTIPFMLGLGAGLDLRFEPDAGIEFGSGVYAGAFQLLTEDGQSPIHLGPASEDGQWKGASIGKASRLEGRGLEVQGSGDAIGLRVAGEGAELEIEDFVLSGHRIGLSVEAGAMAKATRGEISGNSELGAQNLDALACLDLREVYWGSEDGPLDPIDAQDGCAKRRQRWRRRCGQRRYLMGHLTEWIPLAAWAVAPGSGAIYLPLGLARESLR